ncbi:hypothetical protein ScPMuIL_006883 [Solemya velum]
MAETCQQNSCADKIIDEKQENSDKSKEKEEGSGDINNCFTRPGAQITDKQSFKNKNDHSISATPFIIDFNRLFQLTAGTPLAISAADGLISGISNRDLLHAVVGLYDVSLSEMTPDVLYATVCERWARTIILVRDIDETIEDLEERDKKSKQDEKENESENKNVENEQIENTEKEDDVYEPEEATSSKFEEVYSDTESEEEEEEDEEEEEEEEFSKGINSFIGTVIKRRKSRKLCDGPLQKDHVGIENRIVGCITFEKKYIKHKDRVIHITVLSVRKRYRKYGIGRYLLSMIVDPMVVGQYDAVVVHADNAAVEFFQRFGFSDDVILNSRWSELAEQFTNCSLMCFLPGFTGHTLLSTIKIKDLDVLELEQELVKWKERTIEAYQAQVSCMMRLKHEIYQLKYMTNTQSDFIDSLLKDNEKLRTDRFKVEKDLLEYRLSTVNAAFSVERIDREDEDNISTYELIKKLEAQSQLMNTAIEKKNDVISHPAMKGKSKPFCILTKYLSIHTGVHVRSQQEPEGYRKSTDLFSVIPSAFNEGMKQDLSFPGHCEITAISKECVTEAYKEEFEKRVKSLKDSTLVINLYFCGTLERPERIKDILQSGFQESDYSHGEYGRGLYFSKYPSKAAQFSAIGQMLVVQVALGATETVTKINRTRKCPSKGFDSVITPGRLSLQLSEKDVLMSQEYIVFDWRQALPLCLITYQTS